MRIRRAAYPSLSGAPFAPLPGLLRSAPDGHARATQRDVRRAAGATTCSRSAPRCALLRPAAAATNCGDVLRLLAGVDAGRHLAVAAGEAVLRSRTATSAWLGSSMSRFGPTCPTAAAAASVWQVAHVRAKSSRPVASFLVSVMPGGPDARLVLAVGDRDERSAPRDRRRDHDDQPSMRSASRDAALAVQPRRAARPGRR